MDCSSAEVQSVGRVAGTADLADIAAPIRCPWLVVEACWRYSMNSEPAGSRRSGIANGIAAA